MSHLKRLIREIHRHSLWQVLGIYAAASWVVLQVVDVLADNFALPEWFPAFALALLLIGLPLVLATAVVHEGAASATRGPDEDVETALSIGAGEQGEVLSWARADGSLRRFLTWRNAIAGGGVAFALWGVVAAGWLLFGSGAPSVVPATAVTSAGDAPAAAERPSIAVLPFENLSPDPDDAYFADGVHDEILSHLARIGSLKVISRTSVLEYRETPKNIRTIARELGVRSVLEGTVRRAGQRVRITAQLIDAETDAHLWADSYDRDLADIFAIQTEVAAAIARALGTALGEGEERAREAAKPTDNLEAYDFYLRGLDYERRPGNEVRDLGTAAEMYERAVAMDPNFALSWARFGHVRSMMYQFGGADRTEEQRERIREAVERSLALAPDLPEAYKALGYYRYQAHRDYGGALEAYSRAEQGLPGDAELVALQGYVHRRAGNWGQARSALERSAELNPRDVDVLRELGALYRSLREFELASQTFERVLALAPDHVDALHQLVHLPMYREGDSEPLRQQIRQRCSEECERRGFWAIDRWLIALQHGDLEAALEIASDSTLEEFTGPSEYLLPKPLARALAHRFAGDPTRARPAFDSARSILEDLVRQEPDRAPYHAALGYAYAGLGRKEDAIRAGLRATELVPVEADALSGPVLGLHLAWIYGLVGETDAAVEALERFLALPSEEPWTARGLASHPYSRALLDHPRFQRILQEQGEPLTR